MTNLVIGPSGKLKTSTGLKTTVWESMLQLKELFNLDQWVEYTVYRRTSADGTSTSPEMWETLNNKSSLKNEDVLKISNQNTDWIHRVNDEESEKIKKWITQLERDKNDRALTMKGYEQGYGVAMQEVAKYLLDTIHMDVETISGITKIPVKELLALGLDTIES